MKQLITAGIFALLTTGASVSLQAQSIALSDVNATLGASSIATIEYSGDGKWYRFGQGPVLNRGWQQNDVTTFTTTMDFKNSAAHVVMARAETPATPPATPLEPDAVDESVSGAFAWRMMGGTAQPQRGARDDRMIDIWASPLGFVKAALAHNAKVTPVTGGADVAFTMNGRKFIGRINARHQVENVRTWLANPTFGDMEVTYSYSNYRDFDGTQFPTRMVRSQGGFPVWDYNVKALKLNPAVTITVPQDVSSYETPPTRVDTLQIADGVFVFRSGMYNSVAIEQSNRVVVVEAPTDEARSLMVIERIKTLIPGKPIKYVINTHAHLDHSDGLRTFAAANATVLTDVANRPFFEAAWQTPRTLQPDQLSKSRKRATIETMTGKHVIPDALRPIEIYPVLESAHVDAIGPGDGLRMVYLPQEKFLIQADGFTLPGADELPPETPDPDNLNLYNNIRSLKLEVRLLVPLHGDMAHMPDLLKAVGKDELPTEDEGGCKLEIFYC